MIISIHDHTISFPICAKDLRPAVCVSMTFLRLFEFFAAVDFIFSWPQYCSKILNFSKGMYCGRFLSISSSLSYFEQYSALKRLLCILHASQMVFRTQSFPSSRMIYFVYRLYTIKQIIYIRAVINNKIDYKQECSVYVLFLP